MRDTQRHFVGFLTVALICIGASAVQAQSAKGFAVQVSGRWTTETTINGENVDGSQESRAAYEGQAMWTRGKWTTGLGYSHTRLFNFGSGDEFTQGQVFLEARYVVAYTGPLAIYAAGRGALGSFDCGFCSQTYEEQSVITAGGGGGVLLALGSSITLDVGFQYYPLNRRTAKNVEYETPNLPHGMLRAGIAVSP